MFWRIVEFAIEHELTFQRADVAALSAVGLHHASTQDFVALVQKMPEVQLQEGVRGSRALMCKTFWFKDPTFSQAGN